MTVRYELLMLATPEITKDEVAELEKQLDRCIKKADASIVSFERWGKYRLAYPVRKNEYGVYFLVRLEGVIDKIASLINDIRSLLKLKLSTIIMRDMMTRLPDEGSLAYVRPDSLEEAPSPDVDSFLRKNKMDGLLSSNPVHRNQEEDDGDIDSLEAHDGETLEA